MPENRKRTGKLQKGTHRNSVVVTRFYVFNSKWRICIILDSLLVHRSTDNYILFEMTSLQSSCWRVSLLKAFKYRFPFARVNPCDGKEENQRLKLIRGLEDTWNFKLLMARRFIHTTACILNFKPEDDFVLFSGGSLTTAFLMPLEHQFLWLPAFLPIK